MTMEKDNLEEMFDAYRRVNDKAAQQATQEKRRRSSSHKRQVRRCALTLATDVVLAGVLVWLFCTHVTDGGDLAALATIGVLLAIHTATGVRRLVQLKKNDPATAQPEKVLAYAIETAEKRNQPATVLSRHVSIAAAVAAIVFVSVTPVYDGRTMSAMNLRERAGIITNIDEILTSGIVAASQKIIKG